MKRGPTSNTARFDQLVKEYCLRCPTLSEKEKALREDEIRQCAAPEKRRMMTPNPEDWLSDYLPFDRIYDFTIRMRLLRLGDTADAIWVALDQGMPHKFARKAMSGFTEEIEGKGIPKSEHRAIMARVVDKVWEGKEQRRPPRKPKDGAVDASYEVMVREEIRRCSEKGGTTDKEIEQALGMSHESASARRKALLDKGVIRLNGYRRNTNGKRAKLWVIADGKEPPPEAPRREKSAFSEAVHGLRDAFMGMLAMVAAQETGSTVNPKEVLATQAGPWLRSYVLAVLKGVEIPETLTERKVREMTFSFELLLDDWAGNIRSLRTQYQVAQSVGGSIQIDEQEWAEMRRICERFNIAVPTSVYEPVDMEAVERIVRRKRVEIHPDKSFQDPEVFEAKNEQMKALNHDYQKLTDWNDRLEIQAGRKQHDARDNAPDPNGVSSLQAATPTIPEETPHVE